MRNNPRLYQHITERFEEMGSCIGASGKGNALYGAADVCRLAAEAALQNRNLASVAEAGRGGPGAPAGEGARPGISGETVRRVLNRSGTARTNEAFGSLVRSFLEEMWISGALDPDAPLDVAIDKHHEIRYDRKPDEHLVRGVDGAGKPVLKEVYITAQCVAAGHRLVLACLPFGQLDDNESAVAELVRICLGYGIRLGTVMLDREFHATGPMQALERGDTTYLIPCVNRDHVVRILRECAEGRRGRVSEAVITKDRRTSCRYTAVVTERRRRSRKKDGEDPRPEEELIAFATNDPGIDVESYGRRWGIETGFRQVRDIRIKTRCKSRAARHLAFTLSMALYNCWVFACALLGWMHSRTVSAEPVVTLCSTVRDILETARGPSGPGPPDPGWPLP